MSFIEASTFSRSPPFQQFQQFLQWSYHSVNVPANASRRYTTFSTFFSFTSSNWPLFAVKPQPENYRKPQAEIADAEIADVDLADVNLRQLLRS